ncbi:MAG: FG-GAP-like repeat-containing protein [Polyangiales bacterium]
MRIVSRFALGMFGLFALLGCNADDPSPGGAGPMTGPVIPYDAGQDSGYDAAPVDPCESRRCHPGERCERDGDTARCVAQSCDDLGCTDTELCEAHPQGGHVCVDAHCDDDVDCPGDYHCATNLCQVDVCAPGVRRCAGDALRECSESGAEELTRFRCEPGGYFESSCTTATTSDAFCSCGDDWDCPEHTVCETGRCEGSGAAPSCSLPAVPFSDTPPAVELHWGGDSPDQPAAHDGTPARKPAPWPGFSQVLNTPIVANLDDDNGDGLINELDFPEIVFVAHKGDNPWSNGVLRAIHGGGPNKGADYFARCGEQLWTSAAPLSAACADDEPDADSGAPVAVGDLDGDGQPEIVYTTENDKLRILDHTGALVYALPTAWTAGGNGESIALANLDFAGFAEIIVGRSVFVLGRTGQRGLEVTHILTGAGSTGQNQESSMVCPADVIPDRPGQELAAGGTLYGMPSKLATCTTPPCTGELDVIWQALEVAGNTGLTGNGFCAIADLWGADPARAPGPANPPDGKPEVILIDNGDLTVLDGQTGRIISDRPLGGGARGGAPNVDDFDGDGYMEVASALQNFYVVVDLQDSTGAAGSCPEWPTVIARKDAANAGHNPNPARTPGERCTTDADCAEAAVCNLTLKQCVCLHNGWKRDSDDDSSRATSSSVFDFNGDGAAEAIYNDECDFRVYDGRSGEVLFSQPSRSRTWTENPVVADVDNDGNAEVVTGMNTAESMRCDDDPGGVPVGPNGLRVWGDPSDTWVSARRIWNQQSYHVTNVTESGAIPIHPPESWKPWQGRSYNTYRSQPRSFGVAPDLTVAAISVSSPDAQCGSLSDRLEIAFELKNAGDLRVGPGVRVLFYGAWAGKEEQLRDESGEPLERVLQQSLEPGRSLTLTVAFAQQNNQRDALPESIRVTVDPSSKQQPYGAERECHEDNNTRSAEVTAGLRRPDLTITIDEVTMDCPNATVRVTVRNIGNERAGLTTLRIYAGDPDQGGAALADAQLTTTLDPNTEQHVTIDLTALSNRGPLTVHAVIDPDRHIEECNQANNTAVADDLLDCGIAPD